MSEEQEHETGVACICVSDDDKTPIDCAICKNRRWLTVTEWRAAKIAGLFPRP